MPEEPIRSGDRARKRQKSLQRRVLQHLKHHGPKHYDNLFILFDPYRTGETGLAVQALKLGHYVKIDQDRMVQITDVGLRLLEEQSG
ncbi:MAG: hypothetical protein JSS38_17860 [Nitrospira sp.]|nr:hypothetical protein [Nitrospira sp.]MBS0167105.1 hypothetical protein [Nitrospira sp.]